VYAKLYIVWNVKICKLHTLSCMCGGLWSVWYAIGFSHTRLLSVCVAVTCWERKIYRFIMFIDVSCTFTRMHVLVTRETRVKIFWIWKDEKIILLFRLMKKKKKFIQLLNIPICRIKECRSRCKNHPWELKFVESRISVPINRLRRHVLTDI